MNKSFDVVEKILESTVLSLIYLLFNFIAVFTCIQAVVSSSYILKTKNFSSDNFVILLICPIALVAALLLFTYSTEISLDSFKEVVEKITGKKKEEFFQGP